MAWRSGRGGKRGCLELSGLLLPEKAEEDEAEGEDDSDDEGDPADFEFPDAAVEESDRPTPQQKVIIVDEKSQKQHHVVGRLPFVGPWWKVTVTVKQVGSKYHMQGYPSYFLQTDAGENQKHVLSLFFLECQVPETFRRKFFQWLETNPSGISLNFIHLEETLNLFQKSELEGGQSSADTNNVDIFPYIKGSFAGKAVLTALAFPEIVEFLPKLLPRNISGCIGWWHQGKISDEEDKHAKLTKLNKILKEEPWKLGFSKMMYRDLHSSFAEVPWTTFCECRLLEKIPDLQKNALLIYAKLKDRCRKTGYTYEEHDKLTLAVSKDMPVDCAWQSLKFLKDEEIVVTESKLVFLQKLYKAEKDIAATVHNLMNRSSLRLHVGPKGALNFGACTANLNDSVVESKMHDEELCEIGLEESSDISDVQGNCNNSFVCVEQPPKDKMETEVDPDQERAIELLCASPVTVISGKAGCGKTTVVTSLFRLLKETEEEEIRKACDDFEADLDTSDEWNTCSQEFNGNKCRNESLNILFTAPTGRAASLLHKKTNESAYTLCQVIWSYYSWSKRNSEVPWKFSKIKVLVIDEGSLVSVEVLSKVLLLLSCKACLRKLIILGDVRQLPSIDPGNMLADMFEFLKSRDCALDLRTNHRAESQLIIENATRISEQRDPVFDAVVRISGKEVGLMPSPEKKFILIALPAEEDGGYYLQLAIKALLKSGPGLEDAKLSQFISFRRQDCDIINELCCMHYSKHSMRNARNRPHFECGDKVCSTRNAYIKDLRSKNSIQCTRNDNSSDSEPCKCNVCERRRARASANDPHSQEDEKEEEKDHHDDDSRLCNGEIFFIEKDSTVDSRRILTISLPEGEEYTMDYQALLKTSKIKHAWARTIHTFQGSEENTIVYVVGNSGVQNWQHVYTAVTRARSRVYVVASEDQLRAAIARKRSFRKTYLQKRLKYAFAEKLDDSQQASSSQRNGDFAFCSGSSSMDTEDLVVSDAMKSDHLLGATVEADGAAKATPPDGERKRPCELPDECPSPSKTALVRVSLE
ncbi:hypothetical protein lerEdw1_020949 [Lerista edwardsae]|nr:hypothetical protein lerEdw1_020949 [Lerista edwardsae]